MTYTTPTQSRLAICTATTTYDLSFSSTPQVNSLIAVAVVTFGGALGAASVSDNQGNSYSERVEASMSASSDVAIYRTIAATSSGTFTVTVSPTGGSCDYTFSIVEFRGNTTSPDDNTNFDVQSSVNVNSLDITPTENNCLWLGVVGHAGADMTITEITGTLIEENEGGTSNMPISFTYKVQTAAAAESADWTLGSSATWAAVISGFKASAASASKIVKVAGVPLATIKKVEGIATASVKKLSGIPNS